MPNTDLEIKTIQFKRGTQAALEDKLVADKLGVPKAGEPIYETDTRRLKFGDGVTPYKDLPYFGGTGTAVEVPNFIIQDPLNSNQILLYDTEQQAWVNKDLADSENIIYFAEHGLTIKGYDSAKQGSILTKDTEKGLSWEPPVDLSQLNNSVAAAEAAKTEASNYAAQAGSSASQAIQAEGNAKSINLQTMNWVNKKFWWGSLEEYNAEIQENGLNLGTFYFVTPEK